MRNINKVTLIGYIGGDPELRYTAGGAAVANFTVATSQPYKSGEEWKTDTQWHRLVVWGDVAESVSEHIHKGDPVYIEGRITYESWKTEEGETRYNTKIVANVVNSLASTAKSASKTEDDNDDLPWGNEQ